MMITSGDIFLVLFLIFLEGVLSVDNAVVLAIMVKHLPPKQRTRALTYGLVGAVFFRLAALSLATLLMQWRWVKFVGGAYLLFIALKHLLRKEDAPEVNPSINRANFWTTVLWIEIMDIVFAVDSILAAVALSQKLWVVFVGGMSGAILMRFAASGFSRILDRFPGFERTAYQLVLLIGMKIFLEGFHLPMLEFGSPRHPAFWVFWTFMALTIVGGFFGAKKAGIHRLPPSTA